MTLVRLHRVLSAVTIAVIAVAAQGCAWLDYGTSGTSIAVTNTCGDSLIVRLTGEKWDRSTEDQREGELATAGASVRATAINPPDTKEGLVLRISPPAGEPLFVVAIERDRDLKLSIGTNACPFALGVGDGTCDPVIENEELAIACR